MEINQIFVLNRALNGEDIYGMPSFSGLSVSKLHINLIKDDLIKLGILNTYTTFTEKGLWEMKRIDEYKKAEKYVKIANLTIGCVTNKKGILLKNKGTQFTFTSVNTENWLQQIIEVYPFINVETNEIGVEPKTTNLKDLFITYQLNQKNSFILNTFTTNDKNKVIEMYFENNEQLFVYQSKDNKLYNLSSNNVKNMLKERLKVV